MVEQTGQRIQVVSLQAGPGDLDTSILFDLNIRYPSNMILLKETTKPSPNT